MLRTSILLLPCLVCLVWGVALLFTGDKTRPQKIFTWLLFLTSAYFYIDANYVLTNPTMEDYERMVYLDIFGQFITLSLPPVMVIFIRALQGLRSDKWWWSVTFLPALVFGIAAIVIYLLLGVDNAANYIAAIDQSGGDLNVFDGQIYRMHAAVCQKGYNTVLFTEIACLFFFVLKALVDNGFRPAHILRFFTNRRSASTANTMCVFFLLFFIACGIRIVLGRNFLITHFGVSALLSLIIAILMFAIAYIAVWFPDRRFSTWDLSHPKDIPARLGGNKGYLVEADAPHELDSTAYNPQTHEISLLRAIRALRNSRTGEDVAREPQMVKSAATGARSALEAAELAGVSSLMLAFVQYFVSEKPYLNPDLNINDVAEALHTNRTYVSTLVNQNFGMSFRDYLNSQRINYSKGVLINSPGLVLDEVASMCGFTSDSQYVKKFKEITGETPRAWQAAWERKSAK